MTMTTQAPQDKREHPGHRHYGFALGLVAGTCVGAGLMMWLAPGAGVGAALGRLTRRGQAVRDDVAETVARGAHEVALGAQAVERFAVSAVSTRR